MDPNAALVGFLHACEDDERNEVITYIEALTDWIKHGGFLPGVSAIRHDIPAPLHTASSGGWIVGKIT